MLLRLRNRHQPQLQFQHQLRLRLPHPDSATVVRSITFQSYPLRCTISRSQLSTNRSRSSTSKPIRQFTDMRTSSSIRSIITTIRPCWCRAWQLAPANRPVWPSTRTVFSANVNVNHWVGFLNADIRIRKCKKKRSAGSNIYTVEFVNFNLFQIKTNATIYWIIFVIVIFVFETTPTL